MSSKGHQKARTSDISSQALLNYLQGKDQGVVRQSTSPKVNLLSTNLEQKNSKQDKFYSSQKNQQGLGQSPQMKKKGEISPSLLAQLSPASFKQLQKSLSPQSQKTLMMFPQQQERMKKNSSQSKPFNINLRITTKNLHTEQSISQESPSQNMTKFSNYLSPQAKQNIASYSQALKTEHDVQQNQLNEPIVHSSSSKHIKTQPSQNNKQKTNIKSSEKKQQEENQKQLNNLDKLKQHLRLQSMNDHQTLYGGNKQTVKPKMSLGELSEKFSFNNLIKSQAEQIKQFTKRSDDGTPKVSLNGYLSELAIKQNASKQDWKQQSVYLQEMLKAQQKIKKQSDVQINSKPSLSNNGNESSQNSSIPQSIKKQKEELNLILVLKNKKIKLSIEVEKNKIQQLVDLVRCEVEKNKPEGNQQIQTMIGIRTFIQSTPLDYILSKLDLPVELLTQFQNQPLLIQPLYSVPKEMKSKKVGLKDFEFIRCIGSGGFSKVYLVRERSTAIFYAMKLIEKYSIFQQNKQCIVQNERIIMEAINHPFIVKMYYAFESENYLVFILEYCQGGELFFLLRQIKRMKEEQAFFYFTQICLAMKCLHDNNIVYRDIKPENILIDIYGNVRIADFGLSKPNMSQDDMAYSFCGSPEYMAPEMLLKQGHNQSLDLYCLGALLYELVTGLPPFYCKNTDEIYRRIVNQKLTFPQQPLSNEIKDLLSQLLMKNPKKRLDSIDTIFQHQWFQQFGGLKSIQSIMNKSIQPPFSPEYFRFNFDEEEFGKGEEQFLQKIKVLQNTVQENFPREILVSEFYFHFNETSNKNHKRNTARDNSNKKNSSLQKTETEQEDFYSYSQRSGSRNMQHKQNKRVNTLEDYLEQLQQNKSPIQSQKPIMQKHLRMQTELDYQSKKQSTINIPF